MSGLEIAAVGLAASGAIASATSAITSGLQAGELGEFNAEVREREAEDIAAVSGEEAERARRRTRQAIGSLRASSAAQGLVVGEGSPLAAQEQQAAEGELEALSIAFSGSMQEAQRRAEASRQRFRGEALRRQGFMRGAGSLLTGGSRVAGMLGASSLGGGGGQGPALAAAGGT